MKQKKNMTREETHIPVEEHDFDWDWIYIRHEHIYGELCKLQNNVLTVEHNLRLIEDRLSRIEADIKLMRGIIKVQGIE